MKTMTYLSFLLAVFFLITVSSFAQDSSKTKMEHKHKMEMGKDMKHKMEMMKDSTQKMKMDSSKIKEESIIRTGEIDLVAIDKNKDGKVFQDTMDWNVISDESGECPVCGMELKEVGLEKAKENLIKHNFKVK